MSDFLSVQKTSNLQPAGKTFEVTVIRADGTQQHHTV